MKARETDRYTEGARDTERARDRQRDRERVRMTDRQRQREGQRDREREIVERALQLELINLFFYTSETDTVSTKDFAPLDKA